MENVIDICKNCPHRGNQNKCEKCKPSYKRLKRYRLEEVYKEEGKPREILLNNVDEISDKYIDTLKRKYKRPPKSAKIWQNRDKYRPEHIAVAYEQDLKTPEENLLTDQERPIAREIWDIVRNRKGLISYNKIAKKIGLSHTAVNKHIRRIAIKGQGANTLRDMEEAEPAYFCIIRWRKGRYRKCYYKIAGFFYQPEMDDPKEQWWPYEELIKRKPRGVEITGDIVKLSAKRTRKKK